MTTVDQVSALYRIKVESLIRVLRSKFVGSIEIIDVKRDNFDVEDLPEPHPKYIISIKADLSSFDRFIKQEWETICCEYEGIDIMIEEDLQEVEVSK
jgi:hypothetical protein